MRVIYNAMGKFPGKKLKGKEKYQYLYHYTSFDSFVRIWCTQSLKLGAIAGVNDIQERYKPLMISNMHQIPLGKAFHEIRQSYKQLSFTMDFDSYLKGSMSSMMWGYYADKSNGVCIELDYSKLNFPKNAIKGPIKYVKYLKRNIDLPTDLSTIQDIRKFLKRNAKEIFLTKQSSWAGENEYRMVCPDLDFLDIKGAISAVYLTSYDSLECKMVEHLLSQTEIPVKFLHYNSSPTGKFAIPILTDTQSYREQLEAAASNPDNALLKIDKQAEAHLRAHLNNESASLLKSEYKL